MTERGTDRSMNIQPLSRAAAAVKEKHEYLLLGCFMMRLFVNERLCDSAMLRFPETFTHLYIFISCQTEFSKSQYTKTAIISTLPLSLPSPPKLYILSHTSTMCRFGYTQYKPCGCELYLAQDTQFCVIPAGWFPTVVIRRTEELGDLDFYYRRQRFVTVAKNSKTKFHWLSCKDHKCTRNGVLERGAKDPCPVWYLSYLLLPFYS